MSDIVVQMHTTKGIAASRGAKSLDSATTAKGQTSGNTPNAQMASFPLSNQPPLPCLADSENLLAALLYLQGKLPTVLGGIDFVLDCQDDSFRWLAADSILLHGHSVEEALGMGFSLFEEAVSTEDQALCRTMYDAVKHHLGKKTQNWTDSKNYFSCTFRLKQCIGQQEEQAMCYCVLYPWFSDDKSINLVGKLKFSVIPTSGHLRLYSQNGLQYEEFNFDNGRWQKFEIEKLSPTEKRVLLFTLHGKQAGEIAQTLNRAISTIQKHQEHTHRKLNVHSNAEAIVYTLNHSYLLRN